ncbi:hypothetical protein ACQU0X_26020 [Pseudovibrio ascidiaceicola]|uniref:hypothetical protein n=1 Tax=Pseudovibrio ascidiaceicola TaxID=285279 RepID=UPI000AE9D8B0
MRHGLLAYVSRFVVSLAFLALLVAGGTYDHPFGNQTDHVHHGESSQDIPHSHPELQRFSAIDIEAVHCGANLLALTSEIGIEIPSDDESLHDFSSQNRLSKVKAVDPPPPRFFS